MEFKKTRLAVLLALSVFGGATVAHAQSSGQTVEGKVMGVQDVASTDKKAPQATEVPSTANSSKDDKVSSDDGSVDVQNEEVKIDSYVNGTRVKTLEPKDVKTIKDKVKEGAQVASYGDLMIFMTKDGEPIIMDYVGVPVEFFPEEFYEKDFNKAGYIAYLQGLIDHFDYNKRLPSVDDKGNKIELPEDERSEEQKQADRESYRQAMDMLKKDYMQYSQESYNIAKLIPHSEIINGINGVIDKYKKGGKDLPALAVILKELNPKIDVVDLTEQYKNGATELSDDLLVDKNATPKDASFSDKVENKAQAVIEKAKEIKDVAVDKTKEAVNKIMELAASISEKDKAISGDAKSEAKGDDKEQSLQETVKKDLLKDAPEGKKGAVKGEGAKPLDATSGDKNPAEIEQRPLNLTPEQELTKEIFANPKEPIPDLTKATPVLAVDVNKPEQTLSEKAKEVKQGEAAQYQNLKLKEGVDVYQAVMMAFRETMLEQAKTTEDKERIQKILDNPSKYMDEEGSAKPQAPQIDAVRLRQMQQTGVDAFMENL